MGYRQVTILCEGQSEESFVKKVLASYLEKEGVYVTPIVLGGVSRYAGIRKELRKLGKNKSASLTTMLDYYKLPQDVPGVGEGNSKEPGEIASGIEARIYEDLQNEISCKSFFPYIQMHEYEALLLADVDSFRDCIGMSEPMIAELKKEVTKFLTPEHVNNSEQTAPSKRILRIYGKYQKVSDGTLIAMSIGIDKMIDRCPHFAEWVKKLIE